MIAERLGMDPLELRMQNLLATATGDDRRGDGGRALPASCWPSAAAGIGWDASEPADGALRQPKVRAKGLSCIIKGTVTPVDVDRRRQAQRGRQPERPDQLGRDGPGASRRRWPSSPPKKLGLPVDQVPVSDVGHRRHALRPADQLQPRRRYAMGKAVVGGRWTTSGAQLLELAARPAGGRDRTTWRWPGGSRAGQGRTRRRALDLRRGRAPARGAATCWARRPSRTEGGLDPDTGQGIGSVHWHQAAGGAEVEVDLETGKVEVLRYHAAVYAGRIVNPVQAELQTEGSVAFGLGQALFEEMLYDGGQLQNGNLGDYMIASIEDLPAIHLDVLEHPEADDDPWHRRDVAATGHARHRQRRLSRHRRPHHRPADHRREGPARPPCSRRGDCRMTASHLPNRSPAAPRGRGRQGHPDPARQRRRARS